MPGQYSDQDNEDKVPDSRGHQKPNNDLEHLKMMQRLRDTAWPRHMDDLANGASRHKLRG